MYWLASVVLSLLAFSAPAIFRLVLHQTEFPYAPMLLPDHETRNLPGFHRNGFDLLCFQDRFHHFHQPEFFTEPRQQEFNYPAPLAVAFHFFYEASNPLLFFRLFAIACFVVAGILLGRALVRRGLPVASTVVFVASLIVLSYPIQLLLYLANIELVVWIVVALGIVAHVKGRSWWAAALFAVAASMKYFPAVYLGLLLAKKQYRQFGFALLVFAASNLLSLWLLGPTIPFAYHGLRANVGDFTKSYIETFHPLESGMDHSVYSIIKLACYHAHNTRPLRWIAIPYLALAAAGGTAIFFLRIRHLPVANQILALAVASILLPPLSHDYTLIHLYAPFAVLTLLVVQYRLSSRWLWAVYTCFVLLFTSQNYLIYSGIRLAGQLKAVTLLVLFILAVARPVPQELTPA